MRFLFGPGNLQTSERRVLPGPIYDVPHRSAPQDQGEDQRGEGDAPPRYLVSIPVRRPRRARARPARARRSSCFVLGG